MTIEKKLHALPPTEQAPTNGPPTEDEAMSIAKPSAFSLDKFKSKHAAALANVETLLTGLPHHSIAQAKDFVRLHLDEAAYWSPELCFANVPIKGQKRDTLHLIDEELAMRYLPPARITRFRLALATKPYDVFFLVPRADTQRRQHLGGEQFEGLRASENALDRSNEPPGGRGRRLQGRRRPRPGCLP